MSEYREVKRYIVKPQNVESVVLELTQKINGEERAREICDVFSGGNNKVTLQVECIDPDDGEVYHSPVAINENGRFRYMANYMLTHEERERWIA